MGRKIGYARVSTKGQDTTPQVEALIKAGVEQRDIFKDDGVSGAKTSRPGFDKMLENLQDGDTLIVWKLDRLGRNSGHVITLVSTLAERGIHIRSLSDGLDTTTTTGKAMLGILAILAEMERGFAKERTAHALASKKERGITGGRPRKFDDKKAALAQRLYDEGTPVAEIATTLGGVNRATVYRYLNANAAE